MADGFFVETKDLVLFGLAIYGAGLSTVTIALAFLRNRRRLKVTCAVSYYYDPVRFLPYLQIEAVNTGTRPVTVTRINIKLPNGEYMVALPSNYDDVQLRANTELPATLSDGESAKMMIALGNVREGLREQRFSGEVAVIAHVGDSAGKTHESKSYKINTE